MNKAVDASLPQVQAIQPRLPVADLPASYRFYREVLGFASNVPDPSNADGFALMHRDRLGLQLVVARPDDVRAPITIWIQLADALAEHERIKARAQIEWGPEVYWYGCREFAVLDPDGHRIIFSTPTNEAPTCSRD